MINSIIPFTVYDKTINENEVIVENTIDGCTVTWEL